MNRPWMPFYVADYLGDTRHLDNAQHGSYLLLIMHYWQHGLLPEDDAQLWRIAACTSLRQWRQSIKPIVQKFFQDGWRHKRIDEEIAKAEVKHERRSEAGKRGGIASANSKQNSSNASSNAQASSSESERKKDAAPNGAAPPSSEEIDLFRRGKKLLGEAAGGLVALLLKAKDGSVPLARAVIETAATKENPREYIGAVLRKVAPPGHVVTYVDPRL